jgi:hypothetical protein
VPAPVRPIAVEVLEDRTLPSGTALSLAAEPQTVIGRRLNAPLPPHMARGLARIRTVAARSAHGTAHAAPATAAHAPGHRPGTAKGRPPQLAPEAISRPPGAGRNDFQGSFDGAFSPSDIDTAYSISPLLNNGFNGAGETIALIDFYDNPYLLSSNDPNYQSSDLYAFDQQFGLPDPTFLKVDQGGGTNYPPQDPSGGWEFEEDLDVEWAHAIAPQANILLVECDPNDVFSAFSGADWAATPVASGGGGATVVSMSFGIGVIGGNGGFSEESFFDQYFSSASYPGVTFVASAGDSGSVDPNTGQDDQGGQAGYPADSPNVVAAGGTNLEVVGNGNYTYSSESVWNNGFTGPFYQATGGGISNFEPLPGYQKFLVVHSGNKIVNPHGMRAAPDIAFDADPNSGVAFLSQFNGGWYMGGGTSLSAPCWAGLFALTDQIRGNYGLSSLSGDTQTLPELYTLLGNSTTYANDLHDVTAGDNGTWSAGTGYDLDTGLGTPIASNLMPDLAGAFVTGVTSTAANGSYSQGATLPITVAFDVPVTVTGTPQLALNSGGTANYAGGSGTRTLTFNYVVGGGDHSTHLDFSGTTALGLNGGTISVTGSSPGEPADLALMATGSANSLGANKNIVILAVSTTTVTTSNASPGAAGGDPVTLTATVASAGGTPTGTVQFYDDLLPLGTPVALSSGVASFAASTGLLQAANGLTPGLHAVTAVYAPDGASQNVFVASSGVYEQAVRGVPFAAADTFVARVGDGTTPLIDEAASGPHGGLASVGDTIYVDEYTAAGSLVQSLALPTADGTGGQNTIKAVVADGQEAATGQLALSGDGQFLFLTGYDSSLNPANLAAAPELHYSAATPRAVARIKYDGTVQTLGLAAGGGGGETGGDITGVSSPDGNQFYVSGANGVYYSPAFTPSAGLQNPPLITGTSYTVTALEGVGGSLYAAGVPYTGANLVGSYGVYPTTGVVSISSATESGNTVTISTPGGSGFQPGEAVAIAGLTPSGYDGTFTLTSVVGTLFTYTDPNGGLADGGGGAATATPVPGPLPGLPGSDGNANPIDVYFTSLNGNGAPAGVNTMYLSDVGNNVTGGTITKWALVNGAWSLVDTVTAGIGNSAVSFYWLSGRTDAGGNVTLNATYGNGGTSNTGPGQLYSVVDQNGYDAPIGTGGAHSDAVTILAAVGSGDNSGLSTTKNEVFRGAAPAPVMAVAAVTANANTAPILSATETGTTVDVTTDGAHAFVVGQSLDIAGVSDAGYDGTVTVSGVPDATDFTYTDPNSGLADATGGTATSAAAPAAVISSATSSGTTATITTAAAHGFTAGQVVSVAGVSVAGYNGTFTIASVPSSTSFTYTTSGSDLAGGSGGSATLTSPLAGPQRSMVDGITYTFSQAVTLGANAFGLAVHPTVNVATATESGNTVTITTTANHNFVSGQVVTIAGVSNSSYNGTYAITVTGTTTFTYTDPTSGLADVGSV